jgi:hypothetical protein
MTDTRSIVQTDLIYPVRSLFHGDLRVVAVCFVLEARPNSSFIDIADTVQTDLGDEHHWIYI